MNQAESVAENLLECSCFPFLLEAGSARSFFPPSFNFLFFLSSFSLSIVPNEFFFLRFQSVGCNFVTREMSSASLQSEHIRNKLAH